MYSLLSLLSAIVVIAVVIFIMVKLNQIASHLAIIARYTVNQQGNQLPPQQSPSPVKPHGLARLYRQTLIDFLPI